MLNKKIILCALVLLAFLVSCKQKQVIAYDRDRCSVCDMLISNRANSVYTDAGGVHKVFDDIGCLLKQNPNIKASEVFIRPSKSDKFMSAKSLVFVGGNSTPMGYGFFAYLPINAPKGVKTLDFTQLKKAISLLKPKMKMTKMKSKKLDINPKDKIINMGIKIDKISSEKTQTQDKMSSTKIQTKAK